MSTYIPDHKNKAYQRLPSQFKDKPNIKALLDSLVDQYQGAEDSLSTIQSRLDIDNAEGKHLEFIGRLVGITRSRESDSRFRALIKAKIGRNTSKGNHDSLSFVFNLITESERSEMVELFPATVYQLADNDFRDLVPEEERIEFIRDVYDYMQAVVSAGVKYGFSRDTLWRRFFHLRRSKSWQRIWRFF
jgi:hypothetical protein